MRHRSKVTCSRPCTCIIPPVLCMDLGREILKENSWMSNITHVETSGRNGGRGQEREEMRELGNWHPALDALFYSDVSAPESGYCSGDSNGFGACIADHRPREMIFKWAVVVLMGSHFSKANSFQLWTELSKRLLKICWCLSFTQSDFDLVDMVCWLGYGIF